MYITIEDIKKGIMKIDVRNNVIMFAPVVFALVVSQITFVSILVCTFWVILYSSAIHYIQNQTKQEVK